MIKVKIENEQKEYPANTLLKEVASEYQNTQKYDIVLALVDGQLVELHKKIREGSEIKFVTVGHPHGMFTYRMSVPLLMLKAFADVAGREFANKISMEFSVSYGEYCKYSGTEKVDEKLLSRVHNRMRELVQGNIRIVKHSVSTDEAIRMFKSQGMKDKEKMLKFRRVSKVNLYELDGYYDYYFSYLVPSTGYLKYFDLFPYEDGFILNMPMVDNPTELPEFRPRPKLVSVLMETERWGEMMEVDTVGALNERITKGDFNEIALVQEALQEKRIGDIATRISGMSNKRIVLIAGPSSSGKTTFSRRLSVQLKSIGLKPHLISVDDYFLNREMTPKDEFGEYNYEVLEALDLEQFNHDMNALQEGECVQIPSYNFILGKREYKGKYLQLKKDDILVVEGIHCLNDQLTHSIKKEDKFKIFINALTQLNIDEHNRISTSDGRLIRRMVRDSLTRGTDALGTIARWKSVRHGEENFIFPYQEDADVMFNSALVYELSILKQYAEPLLFNVPKESGEYVEAKRLLKFLDFFLGVSSEAVPQNSLLREFIGGSCF
ncbi:nucleoside kinase [Parasporobacterium paucivorans]